MKYNEFILRNESNLKYHWNMIKPDILNWKNQFEWPRNVRLAQALKLRNNLEDLINQDIYQLGYISKYVFDRVLKWGFGRGSSNSEREISKRTMNAIHYLKTDNIVKASLELTSMAGIGISRASKILALSNQTDFGIYDSRSAHGLSDLALYDDTRLPIPPGRIVAGDKHLNNYDFCYGFQLYTWVLRYYRYLALMDPILKKPFARVSDVEIAFFSRSRIGLQQTNSLSLSFLLGSVEVLDKAFNQFQAIIKLEAENEEWRTAYKNAVAEVKSACRCVLDVEAPVRYKEFDGLVKKASEDLLIAMEFVEDLNHIEPENLRISRHYMEKYIGNMTALLRKFKGNHI